MGRRQPISGRIFSGFNYVFLALFMLICLYPFYYVFIYSISDPSLAQKGITVLPAGFTLSNYIKVFSLQGIPNAALISVARTVLGNLLTVMCSAFFAYLVTKEAMYFRKTIYRLVIITMYFGSGLIPVYLTYKMYHLLNNFLVYILPGMVGAFYVILLKTFIEQLPPALEESAKLDGAGIFTIFFRLILPLSKPIIATVAVFAAVGQWNSWFDNYIYISPTFPQLNTLQLMLYNYLNQANALAQQLDKTHITVVRLTPQSVQMTITMIVTLPILFVYPFMQRYFVKGIMLGAVKG